ncbi:hinge connector of long tail fiber proximal connector [Salmonella phage vB_SenM-AKM_NP4]|nr:hypothetical protein PJM34_0241 [Salmonella phage vB_SenM_UTK0003]WLI71866.1 hinge connector of long tail fiber proximal connector [Salmonella phage vB_SenM-AKM_NP4]
MEKMMASFGNGYTKTQVISENNSIKYKISFAAGSVFSTPSSAYFTFQDNPIGNQQDGAGINIRVFNPALNTVSAKKTFLLTPNDNDPGNRAFIEYLSTFTQDNTNLLIFTTSGDIKTSNLVENKFKSIYSTMWPNKWMTSRYSCTYCGLFSIKNNKIIAENVTYSDGVLRDEDIRPALEFVYDKADDIGATGFSYRAVEDFEEYTSSAATIKRYPVDSASGVEISSIGISPGDILFWSFEFLHGDNIPPEVPGTNNNKIRIEIRWLNSSGGWIKSVNVDSNHANAGKWIQHEQTVEVPADAARIVILASKTTPTDTVGTGGVRSMILTETSRATEALTSPSAISVNGIRLNTIVSGDNPTLLILPANEVDSTGKPLPGEDVSGIIYSSDWREFEKNI